MNRAIIIFFLLTASLLAAAAWPGVDYTEIRAFAWDPAKAGYPSKVIRDDFTFVDGVMNKDGTPLTADQALRFVTAARSRRFERFIWTGCYFPHNAFVFFNAAKKPVAYLEVCFDCLIARANPPDKDIDPDFLTLATLCAELKLPFGRRETIKELEKSINWAFRLKTK